MVRLARENLAGLSNAEVRKCNGSDLAGLEDESFDYCYSYAVFQHIPSADVVWNYLREARRVLKPGGLMKVQLNGLPVPAGDSRPEPVRGWSLRAAVPGNLVRPPAVCSPDTWSGVRLRPEEVARFAADEKLHLLSMDGFDSQYLWVVARKPRAERRSHAKDVRRTGIYRVTNTWTEDAIAPRSGRFASASLRGLDLPDDADLNRLRVDVNGVSTAPSFVGKYVQGGPTQVNFYLPPRAALGCSDNPAAIGRRAYFRRGDHSHHWGGADGAETTRNQRRHQFAVAAEHRKPRYSRELGGSRCRRTRGARPGCES